MRSRRRRARSRRCPAPRTDITPPAAPAARSVAMLPIAQELGWPAGVQGVIQVGAWLAAGGTLTP